jgi:uncharacterized protein (DUF1697 family)
MAELRSDLQLLQFRNVRTYIQSGNIVFDSASRTASSLTRKIGAHIEKQHGFRPHILILNREELLTAIVSNPFPKAISNPKTLHFFFLAEAATVADMNALENAKTPTEK